MTNTLHRSKYCSRLEMLVKCLISISLRNSLKKFFGSLAKNLQICAKTKRKKTFRRVNIKIATN